VWDSLRREALSGAPGATALPRRGLHLSGAAAHVQQRLRGSSAPPLPPPPTPLTRTLHSAALRRSSFAVTSPASAAAATRRLQAFWRNVLARHVAAAHRARVAQITRERAAVCVQSLWRAFCARRRCVEEQLVRLYASRDIVASSSSCFGRASPLAAALAAPAAGTRCAHLVPSPPRARTAHNRRATATVIAAYPTVVEGGAVENDGAPTASAEGDAVSALLVRLSASAKAYKRRALMAEARASLAESAVAASKEAKATLVDALSAAESSARRDVSAAAATLAARDSGIQRLEDRLSIADSQVAALRQRVAAAEASAAASAAIAAEELTGARAVSSALKIENVTALSAAAAARAELEAHEKLRTATALALERALNGMARLEAEASRLTAELSHLRSEATEESIARCVVLLGWRVGARPRGRTWGRAHFAAPSL
jgi:hypothetical protein